MAQHLLEALILLRELDQLSIHVVVEFNTLLEFAHCRTLLQPWSGTGEGRERGSGVSVSTRKAITPEEGGNRARTSQRKSLLLPILLLALLLVLLLVLLLLKTAAAAAPLLEFGSTEA